MAVQFILGIFFLAFACIPHITNAVTVGPVKLEYFADPGTEIKGEIFIKNEENISKTFYPSVDEFTEQNGEKMFLKGQGRIAEWFSTSDSVTLRPDESGKIPFTIKVPQDAPPGGQFGVIWWSSAASSTTSQDVSIQTRAGILVYLNVSGNIVESAKITKFDTENSRTFFGKALAPFTLTISNEGNVYIKPKGSLKITSMFGRVVKEIPVNNKGLQILPKSYRSYGDLTWEGSFWSFGPYKAELTAQYGNKQIQQLTESKWIWVFPVHLILMVVAIVVILTVFFNLYNRWLFKKYAEHGKN